MAAVHELTPALGAGAACRVLGLPRGASAGHRAQMYRLSLVGPMPARPVRPRPPLAFDAQENQALLQALNSERFVDTAPAAMHATLLDEGRYLGSVRTMYRLLAALALAQAADTTAVAAGAAARGLRGPGIGQAIGAARAQALASPDAPNGAA